MQTMQLQDFFKYDNFILFLKYISDNYNLFPLGDANKTNGIILRHDVDLDLKAAARLAELENECGIKATYFILCSSTTYNPASKTGRKQIETILNCGCEIGLHFDPAVYNEAPYNVLSEKADIEAQWLENITGKEVRSISLHNPDMTNHFPLFKNFVNAYDPAFFSDDKYISDSRMNFRGKNPYEFIKKASQMTIQILLHPMHFTKEGKNCPDIFSSFIKDFTNEVDNEFTLANDTYSKQKRTDLFTYCKTLKD